LAFLDSVNNYLRVPVRTMTLCILESLFTVFYNFVVKATWLAKARKDLQEFGGCHLGGCVVRGKTINCVAW